MRGVCLGRRIIGGEGARHVGGGGEVAFIGGVAQCGLWVLGRSGWMLHDGGFFGRWSWRSWGRDGSAVGEGVGKRWRERTNLERFGGLADERDGFPFDLWAGVGGHCRTDYVK